MYIGFESCNNGVYIVADKFYKKLSDSTIEEIFKMCAQYIAERDNLYEFKVSIQNKQRHLIKV